MSVQPMVSARALTLSAALLVAAFAMAYLPVLTILWGQWRTNDAYSFGVLVPFISAYLIWTRRDYLTKLPIAPSLATGGAIVGIAAGLLIVGRLAAIVAFQELSLVLMLAGLTLLVLGPRFARSIWFPLAYLLLMLPVWEVVTDRLHYPSQLFSAGLAEWILTTAGVPVFREGVDVHLPNITLEVASACSGVNFLIAVMAIGIPQAYLYLSGLWPRVTVIVFAIAIALLSNGLRVAVIGMLLYFELSESIHGPGHILQGLFVSSFGILALLASVSFLSRRYGQPACPKREAAREAAHRPHDKLRLVGACAGASVVLVMASVVSPNYLLLAAADDVMDEPPAIGDGWRRLEEGVSPPYISEGASAAMSGWLFEAPTGDRVQVFMGNLLWISPEGVTYRSIALPRGVSPSQVALPLSDGETLSVNRAAFFDAGRERQVVFWYDVNGHQTAQVTTAKAYSAVRLLVRWGAAPRVVLVVADSATGEWSNQQLLDRLLRSVSNGLRDPVASSTRHHPRPSTIETAIQLVN